MFIGAPDYYNINKGNWWHYLMAELALPCVGSRKQKHKLQLTPPYLVFNRPPCILLRNFMGTTLFYITLIPRLITARPFSLSELVEGCHTGAKITARVMAFKSISAWPENAECDPRWESWISALHRVTSGSRCAASLFRHHLLTGLKSWFKGHPDHQSDGFVCEPSQK